MKQRLMKGVLAIALSLIAGQACAADEMLFQAAPATPLKIDPVLSALQKIDTSEIMSVVQANASLVNVDTPRLNINLDIGGPNDDRLDSDKPVVLTAERLTSYTNADGSVVWSGIFAETSGKHRSMSNAVADDPMHSVTLVRNGDMISGNLRVFGQLYSITPLRNGQHAIVEVNEAKMPPEEQPVSHPQDVLIRPAPQKGAASAKANDSTLVVMVNYTPAAAAQTADIVGQIQLAVAESNQGYANSDVQVSLTLAGVSQVSYTESGTSGTDLNRYVSPDDGFMDDIHGFRDALTADVGVLLIASTSTCGIAGLNVSAPRGFAVVTRSCATGNYSFGHEIGHLFGAHHDPANAGNGNTRYPYGHGYQSPAAGWRTIMAYDCSQRCTRLNFWSNPGRSYNGQSTGTAATHDNHRVLNERRAAMAGFRVCSFRSDVLNKYNALGGAAGFLGDCLRGETPSPDGVGAFNQFQHGTIYRSPSSGVHEMHGLVLDRWYALGSERGSLGYPISDELTVPDRSGQYQIFQGGYIYWSPATGAHALMGAIEQKWRQLGAEHGFGYPSTDEIATPDNVGRYNHFGDGRSIYWSPSTGAYEVHGAIHAKWTSMGREQSCLGYPTSDEYDAGGGQRRNNFQRGSITWSGPTGAVSSC